MQPSALTDSDLLNLQGPRGPAFPRQFHHSNIRLSSIINQIRAFLLERGIAVRQGQRFLRAGLPTILATPPDVLSPRMVRVGLTNRTG